MKWKSILFLIVGGTGTMFIVWMMPLASGDDPRKVVEFEGPAADRDDLSLRPADGGGPAATASIHEPEAFRFGTPDEAIRGDDDEHADREKRLTEIVHLRKLQANRALEVLKMAGGRRHLAMGSDEATNSLILSGRSEEVELATKILRSLEEGGPEAVRKFVADREKTGESHDLKSDTGPVKREVNLMQDSGKDFEFWIGFPNDNDVE